MIRISASRSRAGAAGFGHVKKQLQARLQCRSTFGTLRQCFQYHCGCWPLHRGRYLVQWHRTPAVLQHEAPREVSLVDARTRHHQFPAQLNRPVFCHRRERCTRNPQEAQNARVLQQNQQVVLEMAELVSSSRIKLLTACKSGSLPFKPIRYFRLTRSLPYGRPLRGHRRKPASKRSRADVGVG